MTDILLVNQYFRPDRAATAQLLSDLAEDAVRASARVTVISGRGRYASEDGRAPLRARETWRGVQIRRVWCTNLGRRTLLHRTADYLTYLISAGLEILLGPRRDLVVCLSTPPFVALLGALAKLRSSKFVYKVEDLYPDVAVALGIVREGSRAHRILGRVARALLARADLCVALDEDMAEALRRRGASRVEIVPNWADGEAIHPDREAGRRYREEQGLPDALTVLYAGNLGLAHRFDAVMEAARDLDAGPDPVSFLFVGAGPRLAEVERAAAALRNVRFLPYQPRRRLHALYNAADVHLVTLRDGLEGLLVPSKYAAALSAGKPVLLVGGRGTRLAREIREHDLGWVCDHSPGQVQEALSQARDEGLRARIGTNARRLFEGKYDRCVATARWIQLLGRGSVADGGGSRAWRRSS